MSDKLLDEHGYDVAERAAILEFDANMTRDKAEALAVKVSELNEDKQ